MPAPTPLSRTNTILMDPTPGRIVRTFAKGNTTVKTPNLLQRQTGPTIYAPMKLPPVTQIPLQPTVAPSRPAPAPLVPSRTPSGPLGSATNTVNQVRK
jgi:hypothetical protein